MWATAAEASAAFALICRPTSNSPASFRARGKSREAVAAIMAGPAGAAVVHLGTRSQAWTYGDRCRRLPHTPTDMGPQWATTGGVRPRHGRA